MFIDRRRQTKAPNGESGEDRLLYCPAIITHSRRHVNTETKNFFRRRGGPAGKSKAAPKRDGLPSVSVYFTEEVRESIASRIAPAVSGPTEFVSS